MSTKGKTVHPNPEALAAVYERMAWFFANRERQRRACATKAEGVSKNSPVGTAGRVHWVTPSITE